MTTYITFSSTLPTSFFTIYSNSIYTSLHFQSYFHLLLLPFPSLIYSSSILSSTIYPSIAYFYLTLNTCHAHTHTHLSKKNLENAQVWRSRCAYVCVCVQFVTSRSHDTGRTYTHTGVNIYINVHTQRDYNSSISGLVFVFLLLIVFLF